MLTAVSLLFIFLALSVGLFISGLVDNYRAALVSDQASAADRQVAIKVLDKMLQKQSTNVDVVSGATYSSNGIINAAKEALKKALKNSKGA